MWPLPRLFTFPPPTLNFSSVCPQSHGIKIKGNEAVARGLGAFRGTNLAKSRSMIDRVSCFSQCIHLYEQLSKANLAIARRPKFSRRLVVYVTKGLRVDTKYHGAVYCQRLVFARRLSTDVWCTVSVAVPAPARQIGLIEAAVTSHRTSIKVVQPCTEMEPTK